jgi:CheY-like chemotaxis protein
MKMTGEAVARAVAVVQEQDQSKLEIKSQDLVHVLLMDDKPEFTGPLKEQLEHWGYSVDVAADPVEGNEFLAHKNYQIIIADMRFPEPFIPGDKFLIQNKEAVLKATTIAITADRGYITYKDALEAMNVTIIDKGEHISELKEITTKTLEEVARQVNQAVINIVGGRVPAAETLPVNPESNERMQRILIRWLKGMGEPEKQSIFYKGNMYSPEDIIAQVEAGTDVGQAHMNMMINLFEDFFEGNKEDGSIQEQL